MMTKTNQTYAEYLAEKIGDKFFTVTFVKANGEIRKLNGRLGVTKHTVSGNTTDAHDEYLCVYDMDKKGYRNVNVGTITSIVCGDFSHVVVTGKNAEKMTHEQFSVLSDMGVI